MSADGRARAGVLLLVAAASTALAVTAGAAEPRGEFARGLRQGRAYRLFVPATRAAAGPVLVVALHGCWQTAEDFALGTRLNEAAGRRGLLVLYPVQGRRDNAFRCWNWYEAANQRAGAGGPAAETGEILALVREVQRQHGLGDPRILVVGLSAGAFMAVNLACVAPDVVAGVGTTAGGPFRCADGAQQSIQCLRGRDLDGAAAAAACVELAGDRPRRLRASLWHGDADEVVDAANLGALTAMFARVTGAGSPSTERRDGASVTVYRTAAGAAAVESWLVPGMGHAWSGGDARGTHTYPRGPDATERILDFLLSP